MLFPSGHVCCEHRNALRKPICRPSRSSLESGRSPQSLRRAAPRDWLDATQADNLHDHVVR
jgi:hypothetical protein